MASSELWVIEFRVDGNGDERYLTYGYDRENMPVFTVHYGYHRRTVARFPAILKFVEPEEDGEWMRLTEDQIAQKYGPQIGPFDTPPQPGD